MDVIGHNGHQADYSAANATIGGSNKPWMQVDRTHRITGMPREEIVTRGLVRSEIPLYRLGGPWGAGAQGRSG